MNIFTPKENLNAVIDLLRYVTHFLQDYNITYWVISATLLGAIRNGLMLPWYDDADISIGHHLIPLLFEKLNSQNVITIRSLPDRYRLFWNAQRLEEYPYPFVDLFPWNCDNCDTRITYTNPIALTTLENEWFTEDEVFPLKRAKFQDFDVWVPRNPYRYLDVNFPKWRTHGRTNGYINSTRTSIDIVEFRIQ